MSHTCIHNIPLPQQILLHFYRFNLVTLTEKAKTIIFTTMQLMNTCGTVVLVTFTPE